jgi:hypothetical protein
VFYQVLKNEHQDIVESSAPSEMKDETAHRVRAGDLEVLATLGSLPAPTERMIFNVCILLCVMMWKRRLMVIHLDQLASCQGTAWDEWS